MAKFARCEKCGIEKLLTGGAMGFMPDGWVSATERRAAEYDLEHIACGPLCMGALMADRAAELHPPVPVHPLCAHDGCQNVPRLAYGVCEQHMTGAQWDADSAAPPQDETPARRG